MLSTVKYSLWTLLLFTYTDFKTIVLPVTIFACAAAPVHSMGQLIYAIFWIWLNLLQVNTSNQYKSIAEDAVNRPWRPIPSGRMSEETAGMLRWLLVPTCTIVSAPYGWGVVVATLTLTIALIGYDEIGLAGHWIGKNVINAIGYASFEFGATIIMGSESELDWIATQSLICSILLIFTTIHAQDFSDTAGDSALGRVTFPIHAPEASRIYTLVALSGWSGGLGWFWSIGLSSRIIFAGLGVFVGWRFYRFRSPDADSNSFIIYNIWLLFAHLLPAHHRWGVFRL